MNLLFSAVASCWRACLRPPRDPLLLSPLLQTPPGQVLEAVRKLCLEGVVGRRIDYCQRRQHHGSQSVRAQTNQNPRGIDLLFFPSLLEFEPSTFWRSFKEPVKVDPKNGLNPFLFRPIQYISTLTGRFELPRGGWSGDAILAQIANVCDLIQSRKLSGICFVFIWGMRNIVNAANLASLELPGRYLLQENPDSTDAAESMRSGRKISLVMRWPCKRINDA